MEMKELEEMADATGMDCLLMYQGAEIWNASRHQLLALANAIEAQAAAKEREACAQINMDKAISLTEEAKTAKEEGDAAAESGSFAMAWVLNVCAHLMRKRGEDHGNVKA